MREQDKRSGLAASAALARRGHATVNPPLPGAAKIVDGRTNVKVYISLEEVGARDGKRRRTEGEEEQGWEGATEEMPYIPLSGQRKTTE